MKRVLMGLVALGVAGCGGGTPAGAPERPPQEVGVVTLRPEPVEVVVELPGRTSAYRVAEVRPQVTGIILKRLFTEGEHVKAGEQLYQIDPATYQASFDSAKAALAKAEAGEHVAKLQLDRRRQLAKSSVISQQEFDDAEAALRQAQADVAAAKASLEEARINLNYTRVLSPISGVIGRSMVTEGALVTSQQAAPMAVVQQMDPMYVDVTQPTSRLMHFRRELDAGRLKNPKPGEMAATLAFDDGVVYGEAGKVQFSEVSVDQSTDSVTLRTVFPNPRGELLPGMFVRAKVVAGTVENGLLVPQRGVTRNPRGQPTALVVGPDNRVALRVLETSRIVGDKWLVSDGLKAGDRVIVEGVQKAAPGAPVNPVEISAQPTEG